MKDLNRYINEALVKTHIQMEDDDQQFVDLILPSGTLWATCNLGAKNPWDIGDFYAWGETTTKKVYNGNTYGLNGYLYTTLTKENDVAYKLNNNQCIPSKQQAEELLVYTKQESTTMNGVNGTRFISLHNPNKFIFFPYCGHIADQQHVFKDHRSEVWLNGKENKMGSVYFLLADNNDIGVYKKTGSLGMNIRPVFL